MRETVVLRDGTEAVIRPIEPADRERLREGFEGASDTSIFRRFHSPHPRLTGGELDYLTEVDQVRHVALIAVDPATGESFGTARFVRDDEHSVTAEFAVGVGDRWMRIGLGSALLESLLERARSLGIVEFTGVIQSDNTAVKRLMESVAGPYESTPAGSGTQEISIRLREIG
jgi:RimJ/RimL family protein N-acetyltransferase